MRPKCYGTVRREGLCYADRIHRTPRDAEPLTTATPLVVVIEDDLASQKTLARVLRAGGFDAATYASAEEFLSSPPQSDPIGLLLDVHLGGMSGLDLQRRLRNEGSTVPVIIITAFDDARSREQAERLGCVAYLRKPCEAETILALLGKLRSAH
jgi:FixJ family two-component response regulator